MKVLLHACCGPCSIVPVKGLKSEGARIMAFFDNPNIHPYTEWEKRHGAFAEHMEREGVRTMPTPAYDVTGWLRQVVFREGTRCRFCYHVRLVSAARMAKRGKFDAFTTSLLYSRFQKHELIREVGETVAAEEGIEFLYRDWRDGWKEGVEESKRLGMYRQQYCGCIYSEEERYKSAGGKG